ncbi:MAG: hypothetical protein HGA49_07040 [Eubacteriaceae bacterium]|nr:hypothetical protein [Eubacteriaceae bacterium]
MDNNLVDQDNAVKLLQQMGARVEILHGLLCNVKLSREGIEIEYVYTVAKANEFLLQRVKPYPLGAGMFTTLDDMIEYIGYDVERLANASNSRVFSLFIEENKKLSRVSYYLENLFLNYNVPKNEMSKLNDMISEIENTIIELNDKCPKI